MSVWHARPLFSGPLSPFLVPIGGDCDRGRRCEARPQDVGLGILALVGCFTRAHSSGCFFTLGRLLVLVCSGFCMCVTFCHNKRLKIAYASSRRELIPLRKKCSHAHAATHASHAYGKSTVTLFVQTWRVIYGLFPIAISSQYSNGHYSKTSLKRRRKRRRKVSQ